MKRSGMPRRRKGLERKPPQAPAATATRLPMTGTRRDTGPSRRVREAVKIRAGYACEGCGISTMGRPYSIQHRVARGMGGTSRPEANSPENLLLLCGSSTSPGGCHLACEQRNAEMHARGLWLWSTQDPALVPVLRHGSEGPEWLLPDGSVTFDEPLGGAA